MPHKSDRARFIQHLEAKVKRQKKEALHRELLEEEDSDQDDIDLYTVSMLRTIKFSALV
jgi:hypothetical protein